MGRASSRIVTLVLCRGDGSVLGSLPPFEVDVPWWQEVGSVVSGARARFGLDVTVLRLLAETRIRPPAGLSPISPKWDLRLRCR
jgi:hypothetical protein